MGNSRAANALCSLTGTQAGCWEPGPVVAGVSQLCPKGVPLRHMAITSAQRARPSPGQHQPSHTHTPGPASTTTAATVPGDSIGEGFSLALVPGATVLMSLGSLTLLGS